MPVLVLLAPASALAAGVEVTLSSVPAAPTGLLLKNGGLYGGAVTGPGNAGSVYQLIPPTTGSSHWSVKVLHVFGYDTQGEGEYPAGAVIPDKAGNLYGTTFGGGVITQYNPVGNGTLFKLVPPSGTQTAWSEQILFQFQTNVQPLVKLAMDAAGNLYLPSGANVLQFTPPTSGAGPYTMTAIPIVPGYASDNTSGVVVDRFGNLFGVAKTTATSSPGYDIVYELIPPAGAGAQWTSQTIATFSSTAHVGQLGIAPNFHLFGTTSPVGKSCDAANCAVFELLKGGNGVWRTQIIHSFAGDPLGNPLSASPTQTYAGDDYQLSFGTGGVVYGAVTPSQAGASANSTIYRLDPPASGQTDWTETALYTFQGTPAGFRAGTPLYVAGNGTLYGTVYGGQTENGNQQSLAFKITQPAKVSKQGLLF